MSHPHNEPTEKVPSTQEGIPAPEGPANLIDTDYVIGQDNITPAPLGIRLDLHGKVFTISAL
ncbi:MAG TPA: BCCT family transporter, partial [Candidatus Halomonas stercoripullorum]|nr:BCCT family transporter [Candidatus Halomonas stercoripullorum]